MCHNGRKAVPFSTRQRPYFHTHLLDTLLKTAEINWATEEDHYVLKSWSEQEMVNLPEITYMAISFVRRISGYTMKHLMMAWRVQHTVKKSTDGYFVIYLRESQIDLIFNWLLSDSGIKITQLIFPRFVSAILLEPAWKQCSRVGRTPNGDQVYMSPPPDNR